MRFLALFLLFACPVPLIAQNESPSLADAAKKARENKGKAKIVVTEETLVSARGPIPDLNLEGLDNSDDVLKAMDQYRRSHTPVETEQVIRDWYNNCDSMFQRAFTENEEIKMRAQDRYAEPRQYPNDARKYQEQRTAEIHSAIQDQRLVQKNNLLIARIQQGIQKVRNGLQVSGLRYDWMKIRFGNGNGSW